MADENVRGGASSSADALEADQAVAASVGEQEQQTHAASPATPSMAPPEKVHQDKKKKKARKRKLLEGWAKDTEGMPF